MSKLKRNKKRNELSRHAKTQRNLKCALLRKTGQSERATHYGFKYNSLEKAELGRQTVSDCQESRRR